MIIKIEGLPEGQKIKHINVDVTFEDDDTPVIKTFTDPSQNVKVPRFENSKTEDLSDDLDQVKIPETDERDKKEIPPEMTDMEF